MQIQPSMGLRAMQVNCDRCNRDVRECECDNDVTPPRQIDQACRNKIRDIQRVVLQKMDLNYNGGSLRGNAF